MDYKFINDLLATAEIPNEGIHSRVLQKDQHVNITLFGFSAGQELSTHSAPTPAVICILNGEAGNRNRQPVDRNLAAYLVA